MGIRLCEKCKYFIPKIGLGMGYCTKYNDEVMNFDYCEYWEVENE